MTSSAAFPVSTIPADLQPPRSSTQLIRLHLQRLADEGRPQKVVAHALGVVPGYVSQLKDGTEMLGLGRLQAFALAVGMSAEEQAELIHARLMELDGRKAEISLEALALWALQVAAPTGDVARLVAMWGEASAPAPELIEGVLDNPHRAQRIAQAMREAVQLELRAMASDAAD